MENAKNQLSEVVRRALAHEPLLVARGRHDAIEVLAKQNCEQVVALVDLAAFFGTSPAAAGVPAGELAEDVFERRHDFPRDIDL